MALKRMLHAGHPIDTGARAVPIYQTTSYVFENADQAAHLFELKQYGDIYPHQQSDNSSFEERVASLENGTRLQLRWQVGWQLNFQQL